VGPHTVQSAARDVLALLREQRMFPHMLVGHSFGGKVVMSMAQQFGAQLPRPVQVCAGAGWAGRGGTTADAVQLWMCFCCDGLSNGSSRSSKCCSGMWHSHVAHKGMDSSML
jgi:pimeloyl-ACP methyl ester carboxylesterase